MDARDTLAFSRPGPARLVVDIDENDQATVQFGDGTDGAIPEAGALLRSPTASAADPTATSRPTP